MEKIGLKAGAIAIYKTPEKEVELNVRLEENTVWLDAHQMAKIFGVNRPAVVKHINNIYRTKELNKKSTCSKMEQVAADGKIRIMNIYNLDMIISVGYRVNSKRATQFRIWATKVLKQHIIQGYTINEKRLLEAQKKFKELQSTITFLQERGTQKQLAGQEKQILTLLADYTKTFRLINQYDKGKIKTPEGKKAAHTLECQECLKIIHQVKNELIAKKEASELFGREVSENFESIVKNLYQTFDAKELYPTLEKKSAHLLYLIIKDHPFVDGNKRIASFLFIYYLDKNNFLFRKTGERKINDNALTALAVLIAESNPKEKEIFIKIILNLVED